MCSLKTKAQTYQPIVVKQCAFRKLQTASSSNSSEKQLMQYLSPPEVILSGRVQEVVEADGFGAPQDVLLWDDVHAAQGERERVHFERLSVPPHRVGQVQLARFDFAHVPVSVTHSYIYQSFI